MKNTLLFLAALSCCLSANAQKITVTIAGNGSTFGGNNGPAKLAGFNMPKDVCMDAYNNLYVVDSANGMIKKISAAKGIITIFAGGGTDSLDGAAATDAVIFPSYMCMDAYGNLFFTSGNMIKEVYALTGRITTIAGSSTAGFAGDGGPATAASLKNPQGIGIDASGNIFVADRANNRIREITAGTRIISTVAGTGALGYTGDGGAATSAKLESPITVAINVAGEILFSDQQPNYPNAYDDAVIRKISPSTGIISTIAKDAGAFDTYDEPALNVILGSITGMCVERSTGNIFFNEWSCSCRDLEFASDTVRIVGGNFGIESFSDDTASPLANMSHPAGICTDARGNVFVADKGNNRIRKIIQLTHTPKFAFGPTQSISPTIGVNYPINYPLATTDVDSGQTETWSVISGPAFGTLSGFPAVISSVGVSHLNIPTGLSYTPTGTSYKTDSFKIQISDGALMDTITIFLADSIASHDTTSNLSVSSGGNKEHAVNIFPNPVSSVLTLQWQNQEPGNSLVTISNLVGKVVYKTEIEQTSANGLTQIDVSALEPGIYFLTINGSDVRKLVKF